jgi:hypothetical protein
MDQDIIKHDNAISSWIGLRVARNGKKARFLMIATDLTLNAEDPDYQKGAVDSLVAAAVAYVGGHPRIDSIEIEQIRQGSLDVTSIGD